MGFLDLFKPRWKHSDAEVRAEAVRQLGDDDDKILAEVLRKDPDPKVRRIALKRVGDTALLAEVARSDEDETVRRAAADKAGELLISAAIADGDEARSLTALHRIEAQRQVAEVARRAALASVRRAALERISDDKALADVARNAGDTATRKAATLRIDDPHALRTIALNDPSEEVCLAAVGRLSDVPALEALLKKSKLKSVRTTAKDRLAELAPAKPAPSAPKAAAQRKALQRQLCARAEAAAGHRDLDEAEQEMQAVREAWDELGQQTGDDELRLRFSRALERWNERKRSGDKKLAPADKVAVEKPVEKPLVTVESPEAIEHARVEAERRAEVAAEEQKARLEADAERARRAAEKAAADEVARKEREARAAEERARKEAERVANQERMVALCVRLEAAHEEADRKQLEQTLKDAQAELDRIGPLPRGDDRALRDRFDRARQQVVIHLQEMRDTEDWKRWANVPLLEALCVKMETLALDGAADAKSAAVELKAAQAAWKAIGPAPREKSEALWARFKKASDEVYGRGKEKFASLDAERAANLAKKEELCGRVEALAESSDWKETAETIKLLQEEWKAVGPAPKEQADAVWKRFRGACDKFFERRKAHFGEVDGARSENLKRQEELCVKVEALAASSEWKETAELIKGYQADWKEIGPGPRAESEAMWKRFRGACDQFFERRKAHFAVLDEERAGNLKKKELLCEKVEALVEVDDDSTLELVRGFQAEWKTIGPAPREVADAVWARFRGACDKIYDRQRRGEAPEPAAPKAVADAPTAPMPSTPADAPTGVSGFTNKLPLAGILDKLNVKPKT